MIYTAIIVIVSLLLLISSLKWLKSSGNKYKRDKRVLALVAIVLLSATFFILYPLFMYFKFDEIYSKEPVDMKLQIYAYPNNTYRGYYDDSMCVKVARRNFSLDVPEDAMYDKLLLDVRSKFVDLELYFKVLFSWDFKRLFTIQQTYKESTEVIEVHGDLIQKTLDGNTISSISGYVFVNGEFENRIDGQEYYLKVVFDRDSLTDYGIVRYKIIEQ